ncbi:MAG: hypothetical protein E6895_06105, partial [Klebsiella sp.]|nr:hypothetical protein [Klebsiella sp.]
PDRRPAKAQFSFSSSRISLFLLKRSSNYRRIPESTFCVLLSAGMYLFQSLKFIFRSGKQSR